VRGGSSACCCSCWAHFRTIAQPAPRGRILDRNGRILAASYHSCSIAVDPQRVADPGAYAARLAFLLEDPGAAPELAARIQERKAAGKRFTYLRRRVDRGVAERVGKAGLPGLDLREEPRREYPHEMAAAALLGAVGADKHGDITGLSGLELKYDGYLRGQDGTSQVFRAGHGRVLYHLFPEKDVAPRMGRDLHTTLDVVLQCIVEDALAAMDERFKPRNACAIVLDPFTGEVLALAGRPALDPRGPRGAAQLEAMRIPAAQCAYPVGSVLKPLVAAWALTRGAVAPDQVFDCGPGYKRFGGRIVHDVKKNGHLDIEHVLIKSSNIGMAQVGLALGIDEMYGFLHRIGFGRPSGIEIAGEQPGRITERAKWTENYTLISVSFGRELMATPMQLLSAYAALLNGGYLIQPTLLRGESRPEPVRVPFTPAASAFVRAALERVVTEGTGRRARLKGVRIGGKTGTSAIELNGQNKRYISSFVGFAPADDPKMVVLVLADDPQKVDGIRPYGGSVAAPAVREIIRRGLPLMNTAMPPESGVRHQKNSNRKVRVAAVHWSSVNAGGRISPSNGRNPDSVDVIPCRSDR